MKDFIDIIVCAFRSVADNKGPLLRALIWPYLVLIVLTVFEEIVLMGSHLFIVIALNLLNLIVYAMLAITVHRIVLLGPESVSRWGPDRLSYREARFALQLLILGLIYFPAAYFWFVHIVLGIGFLIIAIMITSRLSLMLPAIAVEEPMTFKMAWLMTERHQWLMLLVVILFPVFLLLPILALDNVPYSYVVTNLISIIWIVFEIAVLSIAYKKVEAFWAEAVNEEL